MDRLEGSLEAGPVAGRHAPDRRSGARRPGRVSISPDNTAIEGVADDPTLNYGEQVVTCDGGTAAGRTGTDSPTVFVDIEFQEPCGLEPLGLSVTADCDDSEFTELEATDGNHQSG